MKDREILFTAPLSAVAISQANSRRVVSRGIYLAALVLLLTGCTSASQVLNPFYEPPSELALSGKADDSLLGGKETKIDTARQALDYAATYQRALPPSPDKPVMQPAVVRQMWIPDHLNSHGDLVPAHYYYLKVLKERWAVSDAFELEGQLGSKKASGNIPYIRQAPGGH